MNCGELTVTEFMEHCAGYGCHVAWLLKKMLVAPVRARHLPVVTFFLFTFVLYSLFLSNVDPSTIDIVPKQLILQPRYDNRYARLEDVPTPKVEHASCHKLFHDDQPKERAIALQYQKYRNRSLSVDARELIESTSNCQRFRDERKYIMHSISPEEEEFGIAYSIMMYKDSGQVERLLRAIYRPSNYYCIHVDYKSPPIIHESMRQLASCFDNVIISRKSSDVVWGFYTVVEPEMTCMEDLWKFKKWKYFINLTGQEMPLKTNLDLIKIMKIYDGANDIPGISLKRLPARFMERVQYIRTPEMPLENRTRKSEFPLMVNFTKGTVHVTASRAYVDFLLHNPIAVALRYWMNDTFIPDETFFSSLNQNPRLKVPGGYLGGASMSAFTINRYKMWRHTGPCKGKFVRYICIPGLGDLPMLGQSRELFFNKLEDDYQHLVYDCLEELHFNRTREDILGINRIDSTFYEKLPFVMHSRRDIRDSRDWTLTDEELEDWRRDTLAERQEMRRLEELAKMNMTNSTNSEDSHGGHVIQEDELQHKTEKHAKVKAKAKQHNAPSKTRSSKLGNVQGKASKSNPGKGILNSAPAKEKNRGRKMFKSKKR